MALLNKTAFLTHQKCYDQETFLSHNLQNWATFCHTISNFLNDRLGLMALILIRTIQSESVLQLNKMGNALLITIIINMKPWFTILFPIYRAYSWTVSHENGRWLAYICSMQLQWCKSWCRLSLTCHTIKKTFWMIGMAWWFWIW